jgi:hypothetical protein
MLKTIRHTTPLFMRSAAFVTALVLLLVRFGAWMHTHTDSNILAFHYFSTATSNSPLTVTNSANSHPDDTNDRHHESCPLCDYLATAHSEAAQEQALMLCAALIAVCLRASAILFPVYSPQLRLADRAPPAFSALA